MAKYLDSNGLSHFMTLIKTALSGKADTSAIPGPYESTPEMDGTGNKGSSSLYARGNHVHPTDTSRQATLVSGTNIKTVGSQSLLGSGNLTMANIGAAAASHAHGNITSGGDITATAPTIASGDKLIINDESASKVTNGPAFGTDTTKFLRNDGTWDTPPGTANQNAFSNVKVGTTTIAADTTTDTLELVAGSNIALTPDATNDKVTIEATDTDTKNTAGSTDSSSKLFIIGATSQAANPQTYSQDTAYIGTDGHLYSNSKQVVNLSDTQALTNKTYNGYTLGTACQYDQLISFDGSVIDHQTVPSSKAVADYVAAQAAGAATFQGSLVQTDSGSSSAKWTQAELQAANYKKGWYWVVEVAGTYAGNVMEVGDMLFCVSDKGSAYAASDFTAIQNNIETLTTTEIDTLWAAA